MTALLVKVSPDEKQLIDDRAYREGVPTAAWIRYVCLCDVHGDESYRPNATQKELERDSYMQKRWQVADVISSEMEFLQGRSVYRHSDETAARRYALSDEGRKNRRQEEEVARQLSAGRTRMPARGKP